MSSVNIVTAMKVPQVPAITGIKDTATRAALQALKANVDAYRGTAPNSDPLDKAVTFRDLYQLGYISVLVGGKPITYSGASGGTFSATTGDSTVDTSVPPTPTGLTATGALFNIILSWTDPTTLYSNHGYTEIWRADSDNLGLAVLDRVSYSSADSDPIGYTGATKYYWIRFISATGIAGPFNATAGTVGATGTVGNTDITNLAITAAKIADGSVDLGGAKITGLLANTNLAQITDATKIADGLIGDTKLATGAVTATKIASGAIDLGGAAITGLLANTNLAQITDATKIADSLIGNSKLADLVVTANKLAAGVITDNIILNPSAGSGTTDGWAVVEGSGSVAASTADYTEGSYSFLTSAPSVAIGCLARAVVPGETYAVRVQVKGTAGAATGLYLRANEKTTYPSSGYVTVSDRTSFTNFVNNGAVPSAWTVYEYTYTVPAGVYWVTFAVYNYTGGPSGGIYFSEAEMRKQLNATHITAASIGTAQIADAAITSAKIGTAAVGTAAIATAAITTALIASLAVGTGQIADAAITNAKIGTAAVGTANIATAAITTALIANLAVGSGQIADAAITSAKIGTAAVGTAAIANLAVTNALIADLAVDAAKIANATIVDGKIASATITGAKIASATITAANIASATITTTQIASATITGANIASATITDANISSLNADKITAGTIKGLSISATRWYSAGSHATASMPPTSTAVTVNDISAFGTTGSGYIMDSSNNYDAITWTGKSGNQLTGLAASAGHNAYALVVPKTKAIVYCDNTNELYFFGDRGDGNVEPLASIGIIPNGTGNDAIIDIGSSSTACTRRAIYAVSYNAPTITGIGTNASGIYGKSIAGGYGGEFEGNLSLGAIRLVASGGSPDGSKSSGVGAMLVTGPGQLWLNNSGGTNWSLVANSRSAVSGTQLYNLSSGAYWTPPHGFYQIVALPNSWAGGNYLHMQLYANAGWHGAKILDNGYSSGWASFVWCDGTNMRFYAGGGSYYIYYRQMV